MSSQYGELRPTSGWDVLASLGHPSTFQRVSHRGNVTARHSSGGRQPNFAVLNRSRHLYLAGRPSHSGFWSYFLLSSSYGYYVTLCFTTITTTVLWPFFRDHPVEPVPEENFWTLWCKGRLTEADTPTIRLGATPSRLNSAHLHHPPIFYRPDALPAAQPTVSKHWRQLAHLD